MSGAQDGWTGRPVKHAPLCFLVNHEGDGDIGFPERQDEITRETNMGDELVSRDQHR